MDSPHSPPCRRCECAGDKGRLLDDLLLDLAAAGEAGQGISGELPCWMPACRHGCMRESLAAPLLEIFLCCLAPRCAALRHTLSLPYPRIPVLPTCSALYCLQCTSATR
jgi:hypothetical protein